MNVRWLRGSYSVYDDFPGTSPDPSRSGMSSYIVYDNHKKTLTTGTAEMRMNSKYMRAASKANRIRYTSFLLMDCQSLLTSYTVYDDIHEMLVSWSS